MKLLQWMVRIPFTIVLLLGTPLMWIISFSVDGLEEANFFAKEYMKEILRWDFKD